MLAREYAKVGKTPRVIDLGNVDLGTIDGYPLVVYDRDGKLSKVTSPLIEAPQGQLGAIIPLYLGAVFPDNTVKTIGMFHMSPFPGCCGAMIFHDISINRQIVVDSDRWVSKQIKEEIPPATWDKIFGFLKAHMGYSLAIDCVPRKDTMKNKAYPSMGFAHLGSFTNKRTENSIILYAHGLTIAKAGN